MGVICKGGIRGGGGKGPVVLASTVIIIICTLYNYKSLRNNIAINQRIIISFSEYEKARLNNKIQPGKISLITNCS